jgi:4-amino-4-deoxy-L-arabinose transferase-like glycosyltransferase
VVAVVLVVLSTRRDGLDLSPDSVAYLAAADGVANGAGVVGLDGAPQSLYAPGLPWLLALPAAHGVAVEAARILNLVTLATVVLGLGWWLDRWLRRPVAVAAAGAAATAAPLLAVHGWLWSEPLYVLLTAAYLAVLVRIATPGPRATRWIVAAGLLAAAATLVRYVGASVLPVAAVVLLARPVPWRQRVLGTVAFGIAYAVPVGAWLARNAELTGDVAGERVPNAVRATDVLHDGVLTVVRWLTPAGLPLTLRLWSCALLAVAVAVLAGRVWATRSVDPRARVLAVPVGYAVLGFLALFVMTARANVNELGPRLLSPLVVPGIAALAVSADLALDRLPRLGRGVCAVAMVATVGWVLLPTTVRQVSAAGEEALAFNRGAWQAAETRALVAAVPAGAAVVSDDPWGVWYLSGRAVAESPRSRYHASDLAPPHDVADLEAAVRRGPVYLVWFDRPASDYHETPAGLARHVRLDPVARSAAGAVYRVTADG